MITYLKNVAIKKPNAEGFIVVTKNYIEIACDSSDTKPTDGIATGSIALEADTADVYLFNEKTSSWVKAN